jgi:hypothetical protein
MPNNKNKIHRARGAAKRRGQRGKSTPLGGDDKSGRTDMRIVHPFVRLASSSNWTAATVAQSGGTISLNTGGLTVINTAAVAGTYYYGVGIAHCLADLPNYNEFTALFDQYRFKRVDWELTPMWNMATSTSQVAFQVVGGFVHSILDFDDHTTPTASNAGIDAMCQFPSYACESAVSSKVIRRSYVPRMAVAAYSSGVFTSYANTAPSWLDAASPSVEHFGSKVIFEVFNPTGNVASLTFRWTMRYHIECRAPR